MKSNPNIPNYVVSPQGELFDIETGEAVEQIEKGVYRVETSETFFSKLKNRESNIKRRYTVDDLVKIYNHKDSFEVESKKEEQPSKEKETAAAAQGESDFKIEVHGVKYRTATEAGKALGVSSTTVKNRIKKGEQGYKSL